MKWIKYRKFIRRNDDGTDVFLEMGAEYSEANLQIVMNELAYNGEYTVEDDGEPAEQPSKLDVIEAQVVYTAMMTDTLI